MGDDVCFTNLYGTGLEGFNGYYQKQYNQAMNNNLVMIQKKNQEPFKEKEITKLKGKYQYHLDIGKIEGLKNFQSFSINKKQSKMKFMSITL